MTASTARPQPGPTAVTSSPPEAAPRIVAPFSPRRSSSLACWSRVGGTVSGVSPAADGKMNAEAAPLTASMPASMPTLAVPVSTTAAARACASALTNAATRKTRRRDQRSATTPPASMNTTCGTLRAASTSPSAAGEPVRSSTANASATGAMMLPSTATVRAATSQQNGW